MKFKLKQDVRSEYEWKIFVNDTFWIIGLWEAKQQVKPALANAKSQRNRTGQNKLTL